VLTTTTTNHQHLQHQLYIVMSGKVSGKSKSGKAAATGTSQSRSATAGLQLPVGRIHRLLKGNYRINRLLIKGNYVQRLAQQRRFFSSLSVVSTVF
jgi:hypothetical protein